MYAQQQQPPQLNSGNIMNTLKSNMMTFFMIDSMGNKNTPGGTATGSNMASMIWMMILTQVMEFVFSNANQAVDIWMKQFQKQSKEALHSAVAKGLLNEKAKRIAASITVTVNIADHENVVGQALLDYITSSPNTQHISYRQRNFILNQTDIIDLGDDIFVKMTEKLKEVSGDESTAKNGQNTGPGIIQTLEVFTYEKTSEQLREFLERLQRNYVAQLKNKLGKTRYYFSMIPSIAPPNMDGNKDLTRLPNFFAFSMKPFTTNRKFTNLFGEEIEIIRNRVHHFCRNRAWYDEKGIPYTLGLLLSGPPGTGKTSTIKCLANETHRHIISVNLNTDMTKLQLDNLFFNENIMVINEGQTQTVCIPLDQRIYVFEDVDAQNDMVAVQSRTKIGENNQIQIQKERQRSNGEGLEYVRNEVDAAKKDNNSLGEHLKVDLSFLLNLLDGILENPGRILIMTSNHPERLDSALIRPGRIDVIAKFRHCTRKTIQEMAEFFYEKPLDDQQRESLQGLHEDVFTPAELSRIMFEHFHDVDAAFSAMHEYEIEKKRSVMQVGATQNHGVMQVGATQNHGVIQVGATQNHGVMQRDATQNQQSIDTPCSDFERLVTEGVDVGKSCIVNERKIEDWYIGHSNMQTSSFCSLDAAYH